MTDQKNRSNGKGKGNRRSFDFVCGNKRGKLLSGRQIQYSINIRLRTLTAAA
jgi:hypothetical protein